MKRDEKETLWCPECEKVKRRVRLAGGCCPECHYQHLTPRA
ncbi:MAG: hypothetical protein OEM29_05475 [Thermoplasmata archaeon]|nr:hypothetical protein [Thermoplasmata archaeon]